MRTRLIVSLLLGAVGLYSQQSFTESPKPVSFVKTPPLREIKPYVEAAELLPPTDEPHEMDSLANYSAVFEMDPVIQKIAGNQPAPPMLANFAGLGPMDNTCTNPDTEGDVGLNHYMQMVKRSFAIWDKQGNLLYGPENNKTLWSTLPGPWLDHWFTDPIVVYDHLADRWLASNMVYEIQTDYLFWEVIAVSATPDPLGEWYCWAYEFDYMPDYPKFSVWNEEYVMSINNADVATPGVPFMGASIWAFNKQDMINGVPEPAVIAITLPTVNNDFYLSHSSLLPADLDGPPPPLGTPILLMEVKDDAWGFDTDFLNIWELYTDWVNPANSELVDLGAFDVMPFNTNLSPVNFIEQPNTTTKLFAMPDRLMYRLQYRHFDEFDVLTANHTVTSDEPPHAGVRWYELRNSGSNWEVHQQGTFVPDQHNRWMGSVSMDNRGNMALGYSISSTDIFPGIRLTGRYNNDPQNEMTIGEIEVVAGSGSQTQNTRWGDYSCMSIDPADDQTFWYTQMYMPETGNLAWQTQICAVKLAKELTIYPDTLLFNNFQQCMDGKPFIIKNNSWDAIKINSIEEMSFYMNSMWYIDNFNLSFPYVLEAGDSLDFLVKVDFITNDNPAGFYYDSLNIEANSDEAYGVVIGINENLLTGIGVEKSRFDLIQVYPNPFRREITIAIDLEETADCGITIFDQNFSQVEKLVGLKTFDPGMHTFIWNAKSNSENVPGFYYCKIQIGDQTYFKKILLSD